jgi:hypothetical protein
MLNLGNQPPFGQHSITIFHIYIALQIRNVLTKKKKNRNVNKNNNYNNNNNNLTKK